MNIKCVKERAHLSRFLLGINVCIKFIYALLTGLFYPIAFLLKSLNFRVLDVKFEALGHLAIEPDLYLREQVLVKKKSYTILFPPYRSLIKEDSFSSSVSNQFLLKCWRRHFFIIDHIFFYLLLYPLLKSPLLQYSPYFYLAPKVSPEYRKGADYVSIYRNSEKENRGFVPLLKLSEKDKKRGFDVLMKLGVPKDSWFVCFSARGPGYYSKENLKQASCRNSSVGNLELALKEVVKRGGWCLRVGSPFTAALPPSLAQMPQVIDYSHSGFVNDFMDIFLAASCRFAIGPLSGIMEVPRVFGVPCVIPNTVPFGVLSPFSQSIHIFKLQQCKKTGNLISFSDCLKSYLSSSVTDEDYKEFQIELIENTPEEIRDVVIEMCDRLDSHLVYSLEEEALQQKFQSLMNSFNPGFQPLSRVGSKFLKKYQEWVF